jgi:hypothetical protein
MQIRNFDFGGYINDDNRYREADEIGPAEKHMTVQALLQMKYGKRLGGSIYRDLARLAGKAAEQNGGEPGLIFTEGGGHFVSFHDTNGNADDAAF